jgi:Na+-transporting methylmalonyl-CoA/oxaloacetate decarboxylase gamma subunit
MNLINLHKEVNIMRKLFLFLLVALVALVTACSNSASTNEQTDEKTDQEAAKEDENKESEKKQEQKEAAQPFKALAPSEDAKPLEETMTEEELAKMPVVEAHGEDRTRKTPVGETLMEGKTDETDGILKDYRLVAYYGQPNSTKMGILGEMEPEALMTKLKEQTQAYSDADPDRPAIPTIELITTIAQREPGPNGKYYHMTSEEDIDEYAELAKKHNAILMLDVQLGRDTALHQVQLLEKWLKLPYVHVAIDTEFHVEEGQTPGIDLGSVDGSEVQEVVDYVSKFVEENDLPDKIVLVHQFTDHAVTNKQAIKPTDNVEVALNFDGYGDYGTKMSLYRKFVRNEPVQYGGFKIFYNKDKPVLTPAEVLQLDPNPAIINYQ